MNKVTLFSVIISILVIVVFGFVYFTFFTVRPPLEEAQALDSNFYTERQFKQIFNESHKYSLYVPDYFDLVDEDLLQYADVLTGTSVYARSYPNNLNIMNEEICADLAEQIEADLSQSATLRGYERTGAKITNLNGYTSCRVQGSAKVNQLDFDVIQYYILRGDRIYQLYYQGQKEITTNSDLQESIEKSFRVID
jgi:hypothetical protein